MKVLTPIEKTEFTLNIFCKRILPGYLFLKNPELFLKWQGNICKQAALLNTFVINHFVGDDYTVEAYEGFFESELGQYNHCWNYLVHKTNPEKNIICDFTSTINYFDYCAQNNPIAHIPINSNSVVNNNDNISLFSFEKLDINKLLEEKEYFTGLSSAQIISDLTKLLQIAKLW